MYERSRAEGFGPEVKRRIMIGTYVLSHGYYDAYYLQAQKLRRMIADDFQACFKDCDLIAGPVAPTVAWKLGEQDDDPVKAYLADIFTLPASLAGLPGMSVPAGFGEGGMPVGLQLIGNYFDEGRLLHAAHAFQQATDFHTRAPAGASVIMSAPALIRGFEVVIGLETHAQLSTRSKIFSGASTQFGAAPNTQACAVDLALAGHAAGAEPRRGRARHPLRPGGAAPRWRRCRSSRARTTSTPTCPRATRSASTRSRWCRAAMSTSASASSSKRVRLTRAHLEEDAGKSLHEDYAGQTGIDLNRAGTPLLEIVTEPDMRSSAEAVEYAKALHALVVWLGVCDGNMQEGSFRCDANVSVRRPGRRLGTRREVKNLNCFRFLQQAIDFEVQWQIDRIEDGLPIEQATVLFDPDTGETRAMRSKEDAHDYRYFPDPDLPPLVIAPEWVERGARRHARAARGDGAALPARRRPGRRTTRR